MNAKTAKRLRRMAKQASPEHTKRDKRYLTNKTGIIVHNPESTDGTYRVMKRIVRMGEGKC